MKIAILRPRGVIAPYVIDGYISGFTAAGHEVLTIDLKEGFGPPHLQQIQQFQPGYVFCYGFTGLILRNWTQERGGLFRTVGIPLVMAHYDNPFFNLPGEVVWEMQSYPEYYYNFIWDRYLLEIFNKNGMPNGFPIKLATDPVYFYPLDGIAREPQTLSFVGNINTGSMGLDNYPSLVQKFMETVIQMKIDRFDIPLLDICFRVLELSSFGEIKQLFQTNPYSFWANIYYQIHARGSAQYRYAVLKCIGDVPIHIYGASNWEAGNVILHEKVPYGEELSRVYQTYTVNLNLSSIQLETSVNNRVFDVFAGKGFVLSDYKQEMEEVFPDHWQEITFRNLDELGTKGEYYLTHDAERQELTAELYQQVIQHHTYKNRAMEIAGVLRDKLHAGQTAGKP